MENFEQLQGGRAAFREVGWGTVRGETGFESRLQLESPQPRAGFYGGQVTLASESSDPEGSQVC